MMRWDAILTDVVASFPIRGYPSTSVINLS